MSSLIARQAWRPRGRQLLGLLIFSAGILAASSQLWLQLHGDVRLWNALLAGLMAALATTLGALPVLLTRQPGQQVLDAMLGFGAGVMLAACAFSLIVPGLAAANLAGFNQSTSALMIAGGILAGGLLMLLLERWLPHEHFIKGVEGQSHHRLQRVWLFVFAIVLHNIPEGLAIGVGFIGNNAAEASALAGGIAIQDVPEGLVVAGALVQVGYSRRFAVLLAAMSGLVEPLAALAGAWLGSHAALLPLALAFAAGAMLFVISHEIIPESHRQGHERLATSGLMLGFVLMMVLDTALV